MLKRIIFLLTSVSIIFGLTGCNKQKKVDLDKFFESASKIVNDENSKQGELDMTVEKAIFKENKDLLHDALDALKESKDKYINEFGYTEARYDDTVEYFEDFEIIYSLLEGDENLSGRFLGIEEENGLISSGVVVYVLGTSAEEFKKLDFDKLNSTANNKEYFTLNENEGFYFILKDNFLVNITGTYYEHYEEIMKLF